VQNETQIALAGRKARMILKMNALLEPEIIAALYEASKAGVEIDLIVRGVCSLRPGIPEISGNIRVRSVVGRFLEHSRVFYFHNDGSQDVYLASADWMDRNFFRRVEVCFPVLDPALKKRVIGEGLNLYLEDSTQAWEMDRHGQYQCKSSRRGKPVCAQDMLVELLASRQTA
jgi:polyphosphate kinase